MLAMNKRIGSALLISLSLHAAAVAVSIALPNLTDRATNRAATDKANSAAFSIQLVASAVPLPDALSPMVGQGADTVAKLDGALKETNLASTESEDSIAKAISQNSIGDAANSKTKAFESSAAGAQGKDTGLKSVLISALQFDPDFYPENGGRLKVRIDIDEAGIPKAVTRISHSPKNLKLDYFLESILEARFIPAEKDGVLVANTIVVEIDLRLEENLVAQHFIKK
jgi:hypothetical protein